MHSPFTQAADAAVALTAVRSRTPGVHRPSEGAAAVFCTVACGALP
ncbi:MULTISPECIES: hypothetical protein [Corynebacterium]|nr:hypothetical protein [Corynebacterium phoceense]MCQ9340792.1 hypothetical protein [Corynebacterium phoceense]